MRIPYFSKACSGASAIAFLLTPLMVPAAEKAPNTEAAQPHKLGIGNLKFEHLGGPNFTQGGVIPKNAPKDWNLGATGLRGWMFCEQLSTRKARQISITKVAAGSPASGHFQVGDVILGVAGKAFSLDPREEFGRALTEAEGSNGKLDLIRWRAGAIEPITLSLPVLGRYSATAPYDCEKSQRILEQCAERLAKRMQEPGYGQNAITRSLNGLGLLATGESKYHPIIKKEAIWAANFSSESMATWWYGYLTVFLSEYIMATGDESVLPGLRRIAMEAAKGQSFVGSWGHKFANPDGRLPGYGMMNSPGAVLTIGLVLAREAGVDDPEVATAIERSATLLRFYIGKGSVPYGDHAPFMESHEDNGKCGMAAVLFDQLREEKGARFFARMSTAAYGNERDQGHTGNYFNMAWAMPGVSRGGPRATGAWMKEFGGWYFDLARTWDVAFPHQGPPQPTNDSYGGWDATGAYLIAYAMPRKAIRLTGKKPSIVKPFSDELAQQLIHDGRGFHGYRNVIEYKSLGDEEQLSQLSSWSPIVRRRTGIAIGNRKDFPIQRVMALLDAPDINTRLGACEALGWFGQRGAPAIPTLVSTMEKADHLWLRVKAAKALAAIGPPAMEAVPALLRAMAKDPTPEDPRNVEQRYMVSALFHPRLGLLRDSLEGVDPDMLFKAIRAGLANQDGATRGILRTALDQMTIEQARPILPAIQRAIVEPAPSGIMFDGQIQLSGLQLFSRYKVSEGIELLADYVRTMKKHSSQKNVVIILDLLKGYGAHAQRAIPQLERAVEYFENEETDFPKELSLQKAQHVRQAIKEIKAMTNKPELIELNR